MDKPNQLSNRPTETRKVVALLLLLVIFVLFFASVESSTPAFAQEKQPAYVVIEASTGRVLAGNLINQKMEMASTTKILTCICVLENMNIEDYLVVPKSATQVEGSSIYLKEGEKWKIIDLLYGLMLRSGNDSALTLAEGYGMEKFIKLMNLTAIKAGAFSSSFTNPHGLHDENHYTTPLDLAKITAYAYKNSKFVEIVSAKTYYYEHNGERKCFINKNKMLDYLDGANGVKTGYTKNSGRCLVTGAKRDDMQLISVVLNEPDMWLKSSELLDKAFKTYKMRKILSNEDIKTLNFNGKDVSVHVLNDIFYPLTDDELYQIDYDFVVRKDIKKPKSNAEIGAVIIKHKNHLIYKQKLYTIV